MNPPRVGTAPDATGPAPLLTATIPELSYTPLLLAFTELRHPAIRHKASPTAPEVAPTLVQGSPAIHDHRRRNPCPRTPPSG